MGVFYNMFQSKRDHFKVMYVCRITKKAVGGRHLHQYSVYVGGRHLHQYSVYVCGRHLHQYSVYLGGRHLHQYSVYLEGE